MAMNNFAMNNELQIQQRKQHDLMNNDTYLRLILEFSSSMELIKTIILLSKYHNHYIHSNKYSHQLINRILQREFGCVIKDNTNNIKSYNNPLNAIQTMHNYWDDTKVNSHLNFMQRIMEHYKQWTVHGLLHFMTKISTKQNILLNELSFNMISEQFERLQIHQQHNEHFIHLLWNNTIETVTNTNNNSDDENWMSDNENETEENPLQKLYSIQPELEKYLQLLYYFNQNENYEMQQEDIFIFYRIFEIVNLNTQNKMLEMLVTPDTVMTEIFTFLIDIIEGQRPITIINLYDDFNRQWPKWSQPFINSLLPAVIKYAILYAQLDDEFDEFEHGIDIINIDADSVTRRWSMSDICIEIADIIGQYKVYEIFLELLNDTNIHDWKYYESILFCIGTHTKVTCIDENDIKMKQSHPLYQIFVKIIDLKVMDCTMVRNRAIYLFGHHCRFLNANDYILKTYFDRFIISTLCNNKWSSQTKTFAANALKRVCESFRGKDIPLVVMQSTYNMYINGLKNKNKMLNIKQEILIIIGLTTMITGFDDLNEIEHAIDYMIQIPYKHLCRLTRSMAMDDTKQDIVAENDDNEMEVVETMKRLSTIFKYFKLESDSNGLPLKALLKIWSQILYLLEHKTGQDDIMEYSIRCLKHVIRECSNEYKQCILFLSFFQKIIHLYVNKSQRSSFLYIISIYLDEYSTNNCILRLFSSSMYEITLTTFKVASTEQLFVKNHEMIEDFYEMVKVYMRTRKKHMFEHNMYCIKWIFEMGVNGLLLTNVNAHVAIVSFYQQFFDNDLNNNNCKNFIDNIYFKYGELLIHKILFGLCGNIKKVSRAKELAELMNNIYVYNKSHCRLLMKEQIQKIKIDKMNENDKNRVITSFCSAITKKQRIQMLTNWYNQCK